MVKSIMYEDLSGKETEFTLIDKFIFEQKLIFVFYNEKHYQRKEILFLECFEDGSFSDDILNYENIISFYNKLSE